ncbi:MAG: hypothetical protein Q7R34_08050 [Dehalococcoidia bacterium]|nr:hypothetical protein [Dehalococcoidia bacterium]
MKKPLLYVLILILLALTVLPACQYLKPTPIPPPAQTARPNPTTQPTQAARSTPTSAPAAPLVVRTPTPATPASAPPGAPAPLISKTLEPSSSPQLVSYQDRVGVIIPGGTLQSRQTVTISTAPNLPAHPSKGFTQLAAYDVSMGNVREFKEPLTIEIAYDPSTIPSNISPDKALSVAWWDAVQKVWINAPFAVDTTRNVIMIPTTHLTIWEVVAVAKGWALKETEHFKIYFDPGSSFNVGGSTGPAANLATEVGTSLEKAYKAYNDAKFSMRLTFIPTTAIGTFMGTLTGGIIGGVAGGYAGGLAGARAGMNAGGRIGATVGTAAGAILVGSKTYVVLDSATVSAEWNKTYLGEIYVPLKHTSYDEMRHDVAHELFHAVQNGYFSVSESGMVGDYLGTNVHWWTEATADYAPVAFGLSNLDALPKITPKYFQQALPTEGNEREYITSRFIAYMAKRGVDFKAMWDAAACLACTERLTTTMLRKVEMYLDQRPPNLHNRFRTFAAEMFFDSNSPLDLGTGKELKTLETSGAVSQNTPLSATDSTISYPFKLPADYTAQLWRIPVSFNPSQTERSLKVEVIGAMPSRDRVTVTASVLPNDQRVLTSVTTKLLNEGNQTANVTVKKNDTIYIMAVNSLTTDLILTVKVTDVSLIISPPTASVDAGKNVTFTTPGVKEKVLWTVQEGASGGTISAAGVYTAPDKAGTSYVVATLESDRTRTGTATITTTKTAGSTPVVSTPTTTSLKLEIPGYWGHLSYTITGAQLDPPTGGDRGRVAGRQYQGKLAGNTLTVSGTAVSDNVSSGPGSGDYYELVVSVTVGKENKKFEYIAPKGEKMSKPFSLSVPVDPGATSGSFSISLLEQNANNGVYGWVVGGSLTR